MTIAIVAGLVSPALAQDSFPKADRELTREEKNDALRAAYQRIYGPQAAPLPTPEPVKTAEAKPATRPKADVCQRHGMRKVVTGKSWRCRRR